MQIWKLEFASQIALINSSLTKAAASARINVDKVTMQTTTLGNVLKIAANSQINR
jgi:hypothetical protein